MAKKRLVGKKTRGHLLSKLANNKPAPRIKLSPLKTRRRTKPTNIRRRISLL